MLDTSGIFQTLSVWGTLSYIFPPPAVSSPREPTVFDNEPRPALAPSQFWQNSCFLPTDCFRSYRHSGLSARDPTRSSSLLFQGTPPYLSPPLARPAFSPNFTDIESNIGLAHLNQPTPSYENLSATGGTSPFPRGRSHWRLLLTCAHGQSSPILSTWDKHQEPPLVLAPLACLPSHHDLSCAFRPQPPPLFLWNPPVRIVYPHVISRPTPPFYLPPGFPPLSLSPPYSPVMLTPPSSSLPWTSANPPFFTHPCV